MARQREVTTGNFWIVAIVLAAIVVAIVAVTSIDRSGEDGSGLGNAFDYKIDDYQKVDPALLIYDPSGELSTGLAIARAVLADPSILVLDEATSSIDTRTEKIIQEAMLRLMEGRTSFVIAHRLSMIRDADQIIVLDHGRIQEIGPHKQLMAQKGFYYGLYMSQFKKELLSI